MRHKKQKLYISHPILTWKDIAYMGQTRWHFTQA